MTQKVVAIANFNVSSFHDSVIVQNKIPSWCVRACHTIAGFATLLVRRFRVLSSSFMTTDEGVVVTDRGALHENTFPGVPYSD